MPSTNGTFDFFTGGRATEPGKLTAACVACRGALLTEDAVGDKGIAGIVAGPGVGGAGVDGVCGSDNCADCAPVSDGGVDGKGIEGKVVAPGVGCTDEAGGGGGSANDADDGPLSDDVGSDNGIEGRVAEPVIGGGAPGTCGSINGVEDCGIDVEVCGVSDDEVGAGANSPVTLPVRTLFSTGGATTVL